jgi:hypothetical protein
MGQVIGPGGLGHGGIALDDVQDQSCLALYLSWINASFVAQVATIKKKLNR